MKANSYRSGLRRADQVRENLTSFWKKRFTFQTLHLIEIGEKLLRVQEIISLYSYKGKRTFAKPSIVKWVFPMLAPKICVVPEVFLNISPGIKPEIPSEGAPGNSSKSLPETSAVAYFFFFWEIHSSKIIIFFIQPINNGLFWGVSQGFFRWLIDWWLLLLLYHRDFQH